MRKTALALILFAAPLAAQTCAKQPAVSVKEVYEWGCKGMDYSAAWDTLTAAGIAPVRPAKVTELGAKVNYGSRKQGLVRGLRILGFATSIVAAYFGEDLKGWQIGMLAAGPEVTAQGVTFFSGAPDEFVQTPSDAGFVTIYSGPTDKQIVGQAASEPAKINPGFIPSTYLRPEPVRVITAHWSVLLADTARERNAALAEWRQHEIAGRAMAREDAVQDAERNMNFHEAERLMAAK